jgi:hypothetical protein
MDIKEAAREIPIALNADVIVAGGGVAGISAALSAARSGVDTILVERYGFLGGTVTACPMKWIGGYNPKVHGGIMREVIERLRREDGITREFHNPIIGGLMIEVALDVFKEVSISMLEKAGARLLFHSWIADSIVEDCKICGVIIESKSGRQAITSKIVIDATGDADVAARAGASCEIGRPQDGRTQAMTLCGPTMDNVDTASLITFIHSYNKEHPEDIKEFIDNGSVFAASGFTQFIKRAKDESGLSIGYDTIWINGKRGDPKVELSGSTVAGADGTNVLDLTRAEVISAKQLADMVAIAKKYIPGFKNSIRMDRGSAAIGVRETRRVMGRYILTEEDIVNGRKFDDAIAQNSTPMDVHSPEGSQSWTQAHPYDIPYRCLVSKNVDNLLVAGRCISTTSRALASTRFIPCCMATGEAAGVAAAISVEKGVPPSSLNGAEIRKILIKAGV